MRLWLTTSPLDNTPSCIDFRRMPRFFPLLLLAGVMLAHVAATGRPPPVNLDESKVPPYTLPDPLMHIDGTLVRSVADWQERRRPELLEQFATLVYGRTPANLPPAMHWEVTAIDREALGGKAVRKEISIWFTEGKEGPALHLLLYQPAGPAPDEGWPTFVGLNFFGNQAVHSDPGITLSTAWMRPRTAFHIVDNRVTEGTRGVQADNWQIEAVLARGFATATAYYGDLCPDRSSGLTEAVGALFGSPHHTQRDDEQWGAIGIWAWGLSRAMDYLASDPEIDADRVAVHGHSRLGKAALWAGAQDERFALVISNNSGSAGAKLMKRNFGSSIAVATAKFPFWWCRNYARFSQREHAIPIDQHELIALIAPRAVHVGSASRDLHADPRGEFLSLHYAEPVYRLFGKEGLGTATMPAEGEAVLGDTLAYHLRPGAHAITPADWQYYLAFAERVLGAKNTP